MHYCTATVLVNSYSPLDPISLPFGPRESASRLPFCLWSIAVFCSLQLEGISQAVQEVSRELATALQTISMFINKGRKSYNKFM
jgi:hypothetical protein